MNLWFSQCCGIRLLVVLLFLVLGAAHQLAVGDGVHIVDDHLEGGGAALKLGPLLHLGDMGPLDIVVEGQVAEAEEPDGAFVDRKSVV